MAGNFIKHIERARAAATQPARPAEKPLEELTSTELEEQLRQARVEAIEANRALAQAAADERTRPATTLSQVLGGLQKSKRRSWR